jgi:hypothetical protein
MPAVSELNDSGRCRGKNARAYSHGVLNCSQIMTLIESEFDGPTTWSKRDVQNLFQTVKNLKAERHQFVTLPNSKVAEGWKTYMQLNEDNLRFERIYWILKRDKESYSYFDDVLECMQRFSHLV